MIMAYVRDRDAGDFAGFTGGLRIKRYVDELFLRVEQGRFLLGHKPNDVNFAIVQLVNFKVQGQSLAEQRSCLLRRKAEAVYASRRLLRTGSLVRFTDQANS